MTVRMWAMVAFACALVVAGAGCSTRRSVLLDSHNPDIRCALNGIYFGDDHVEIRQVIEILNDYDVPHDRVIHIRLDPDVKDLREARALMVSLARNGYSRPVLVTERHAESVNTGKKKRQEDSFSGGREGASRPPAKIRYKKAAE